MGNGKAAVTKKSIYSVEEFDAIRAEKDEQLNCEKYESVYPIETWTHLREQYAKFNDIDNDVGYQPNSYVEISDAGISAAIDFDEGEEVIQLRPVFFSDMAEYVKFVEFLDDESACWMLEWSWTKVIGKPGRKMIGLELDECTIM